MLSENQLQTIMPGLPATKRAVLLPFLQSAMSEFTIDVPARQAAFLAQLAHESGELRFMEEIWGPTDAQRRYEPPTTLAAKLGNTETGDGKRFKGRGPIQITGRANYRRFGDLLQVDLVADPPRAAAPELAFRIAGLFWTKNGLNELADQATGDAFRQITRRINGGFNGLPDRERFYAVACGVLGVVPTTTRGVSRGRAGLRPTPAIEPPFQRGAEVIEAVQPTAPTPATVPPPAETTRSATPARKRARPAARAKAKPESRPTTATARKRKSQPTTRAQSTRRPGEKSATTKNERTTAAERAESQSKARSKRVTQKRRAAKR